MSGADNQSSRTFVRYLIGCMGLVLLGAAVMMAVRPQSIGLEAEEGLLLAVGFAVAGLADIWLFRAWPRLLVGKR